MKMELRAIMELRDGRGSQLGEEDSPFIVKRKIQPLSTYLARDVWYYRTRHAVLPQGPAVLPHGIAVLPLAQGEAGTKEKLRLQSCERKTMGVIRMCTC